jgi:hypothetical protein
MRKRRRPDKRNSRKKAVECHADGIRVDMNSGSALVEADANSDLDGVAGPVAAAQEEIPTAAKIEEKRADWCVPAKLFRL